MTPRVVDIHVGTKINSDTFVKAKAAGIWAIIHKATEGSTYRDKTYAIRRKMVSDAGLLWGAYHFNYGNNVDGQINNFLSYADPDENTLVCLDWETYKVNMTINAALAFLKKMEDRTGKTATMYTGYPLRIDFPKLSEEDKKYIATRKIWWASYTQALTLPKNFAAYGGKWSLWQYTGDGSGQSPHTVAGFGNGIDLSVYNGTDFDEFSTWWIN